ncbi:GGDEF domain-containing protein [Roseateles sp. BYS180W]|uniref:diguanylate cyclase n=1 Tax=Roseateles rivi TaxID=3299028 RepID=A0ABW7FXB9_9BURK
MRAPQKFTQCVQAVRNIQAPHRKPGQHSQRALWIEVALLLLGLLLLHFLFDYIDAYERFYEFSRRHESWELDELMVTVTLSPVFLAIFAARRWREAQARLEQSLTDELTLIPNRRHGSSVLAEEVRRALRYERPLAVVLMDLDHFKAVNDQLGHDVGDQVLRQAARTLMLGIRQQDLLCRWGGEEFLLICPEVNLDQVQQLALRLLDALSQDVSSALGPVTASMGVAALRPEGEHPDALIKRADVALGQAKGAGRNRVVCAPFV